MRRVHHIANANPGFHRFLLDIAGTGGAYDTGYLVNPDVEPELRRHLNRVLVLGDAVQDDDPWTRL